MVVALLPWHGSARWSQSCTRELCTDIFFGISWKMSNLYCYRFYNRICSSGHLRHLPSAFDALLNRIILEVPQDQTRLRNYIIAARRRSRLCRCARVASPVYTSRQWAKMNKGGDRAGRGTDPEVVGQCITAGCPSGEAYRSDVYITREAWMRGKEHTVACPRRNPAIV